MQLGLAEPSEMPKLIVSQKDLGSREMAQCLRALDALCGTWVQFIAPISQLTTLCNSSSRQYINTHNTNMDKYFLKHKNNLIFTLENIERVKVFVKNYTTQKKSQEQKK